VRKYLNGIKFLVLTALLVFLFGFAHRKNESKKVSDIIIEFEEGNNLFMNYEMVNKMLIQNGKTLKNQSKLVVDLHQLETTVRSHPMVENAAVFLTIDGSLKTKIKQRTPIARVISENNSYYIDKQAKMMPLSPNHAARVPIISGRISETDIKKIFELVTAVSNNEFLNKQIVGIRKKENGEFILDTRLSDQQVLVGKAEGLKQKFKNLTAFYRKAQKDNTITDYSMINIKFDNQVVCTKR
jgi:cell division protein FtsQ